MSLNILKMQFIETKILKCPVQKLYDFGLTYFEKFNTIFCLSSIIERKKFKGYNLTLSSNATI